MEICKICNESFKSRRSLIYHLKNFHKISPKEYYISYDNLKIEKCLFCDNDVSWHERKLKYNKTCSNKSCTAKYAKLKSDQAVKEKYGVTNVFSLKEVIKKSKETKKERYGDENYNNTEKNKQTCIKRYGVDNGSKTEYAKEIISEKNTLNAIDRTKKIKETFLKKYGVSSNFKTKETKEKKKETYLKNWNVDHPMKSEKFKKIFKNAIKEKYGVENVIYDLVIKEKIKTTNFNKRKKRILNKFGNIVKEFPSMYEVKIECPICKKTSVLNIAFMEQRDRFDCDICLNCNPYKEYSKSQKELNEWIKSIGFNTIFNYKMKSNKEIDVFIPEYNIGFEYNGVYWHNEIRKDKNYHINKKINGFNEGINIVNIWEDDWKFNNNFIKNKIKKLLLKSANLIKIKDCIIKEISEKKARIFLEENYIKNYNFNSKIKIGLFYKDELISVMILGKYLNKNNYKIFKYIIKNDYTVIDEFNKMLNLFIKKYNPKNIYAYLDLDWGYFKDNIYEKNEFKFIKKLDPDYFWVIKGKREKFKKINLINEDTKLNEVQIMHNKKYYRVFDCGKLLYKKIIY